jgi:hypothetical protein
VRDDGPRMMIVPIYQTPHYQVEPDAVTQVAAANESAYAPRLVGGPVVFTDYVQVATNR